MTAFNYLLSITTSHQQDEISLDIRSMGGRITGLYGISNEMIRKDAWFVLEVSKTKQEVITQLQALPAIQSPYVVALSNPVQEVELTEVRALLTDFGWNTNTVLDTDLELFLNDKLQGLYTYYIDYDHRQYGREPVDIHIKPLVEHPQYSPDWLKNDNPNQEPPGNELNDYSIVIRDVIIEMVEEEEREPPPPPPGYSEQTKNE